MWCTFCAVQLLQVLFDGRVLFVRMCWFTMRVDPRSESTNGFFGNFHCLRRFQLQLKSMVLGGHEQLSCAC